MKKKVNLKRKSTKGELNTGDFIRETFEFLDGNSSWSVKNAMSGSIEKGFVLVKKPRGTQIHIMWKQNSSNFLEFPLLEAVAMMAEGKLCIMGELNGNIYAISLHRLVNYVIETGISFKILRNYCIFNRIGCSEVKKPLNEQRSDRKPGENLVGYSKLVKTNNRIKADPCFSMNKVFQPSVIVKIPDGHGLPNQSALCLGINDTNVGYIPCIVPFSLKSIVIVSEGL